MIFTLNQKRCILIADDEVKSVRAIGDFLALNGFHVFTATDGGTALQMFCENNKTVDLILLDVMMPIRDGLSVLREIRSSSLVPVILLTARGEEYDQISGFQAGADDYIAKPFSPSLLLARIEAVLKRMGKNSSQDILAGNLRINTLKRAAALNGSPLDLTPKEFDLLYYFTLNRGISLTRNQILNAVWGYDFEGDIRTVDTHIKQLRGKLLEYAHYIKTIHRVGYQFEVE